MLFLKNIGKSLLYSFVCLLGITFIITILNYINFINIKIVNIFSYISPFISFLIGGFIIGKNSLKKGWLEGLKLSLIIIAILFTLNFFVFDQGYTINNLILYLIVLISSIIGSMIGISTKQNH